MKEYNINLREEVFGGTLNVIEKGKRFYINKEETKELILNNKYPDDIAEYINNNNIIPNIRITKLNGNEKNDKFSFPDIVFLELTRACNLRCRHCLNNSGISLPNQLNFDEFKKIIGELAEAGLQEIRFTGGEPLLFQGIYDLIEYATSLGIYASIGTNGIAVNEEIAKKLKKAGLKKAVLSVDGIKEAHDYIRGNGMYDRVMNAIECLKKENISIKINSVVMKNNLESIIKLAGQMEEAKNNLFIRRFIESGRGKNLKRNTLNKEEYKYLNNRLKDLLNKSEYVRGHYVRLKDETEEARIEIPFGVTKSCKAGQRALVITPDGEMHFCGFLAAQGFPAIGNIRKVEDIRKFWTDIDYKGKLKDLFIKLDEYNKLENVQETNCLAYAQGMINKEENNDK